MIEGKKVIDIAQLVDVFEAQEGEVQSYSGRIGNGKTYGATRRAIRDLQKGRSVYTNWPLILDHFNGDQRKSLAHAFWHFLVFRKRFYNIDIKQNWHYFDMEDEATWYIKGKHYDNLIDFIANLTDCIVYLDEGQDIFDSYEGTNMSKKKRKSITRTRHLRKTLVVISQRPQAIAVTARANVNTFYKHVKAFALGSLIYFKVYATEEIDAQNMPIWEQAEVKESYFASKKIYNAYNSWYLRGGIPISQEINFEAYDLNFFQRFSLLLSHLSLSTPRLKPRRGREKIASKSLGVKTKATIKNDTREYMRIPVTSMSMLRQVPLLVPAKHAVLSGEEEKTPF